MCGCCRLCTAAVLAGMGAAVRQLSREDKHVPPGWMQLWMWM